MKQPSLAIVAKLDRGAADKVRAHWARLAALGHEDTPARIGVAPHVTLAILARSQASETACRAVLDKISGAGAIGLTFTALAMFPARKEDYYFLAPAASGPLLQLHGRVHADLRDRGAEVAPQTRPGLWTPHCSLSQGVRENRAGEVVALLQDHWQPIEATLDRLALIAFPPADQLAEVLL